MPDHPYVGLWITLDRRVWHELLSDGRYTESDGSGKISQGHYSINGDHVDYVDDAGIASAGLLINGVLHRNGLYLYIDEDISYT